MTAARPELAPSPRDTAISAFLTAAGWGNATRNPLAGDASARRYERLHDIGQGAAVLMDADPSRGEGVGPFLQISEHLAQLGLSAPAILHSDPEHGLLLIEDLGDDLFARRIERRPDEERELYTAAVDLLADLHRAPLPPNVPRYGPDEMGPLAALAATWYAPSASGTPRDGSAEEALRDAATELLDQHAPETSVLALRDYHAENLIWLPDRQANGRVGLLDYQDAAAGHPAYDLVSLLADARRDVPPDLRNSMTARYAATAGRDPEMLAAACAALSAQRNLRILGVFARLSLRDGKAGYVALIPRVWRNLQIDLSHPACAPLRALVERLLPAPTESVLGTLRNRAGACPTP